MIRKFSRKNGFLFPYNCFSIWWDRIERHGTVSFRVGEDTYLCIIYLSNSRIQMIPRAEEGCNLRLIKRCLPGREELESLIASLFFPDFPRPLYAREKPVKLIRERRMISLLPFFFTSKFTKPTPPLSFCFLTRMSIPAFYNSKKRKREKILHLWYYSSISLQTLISQIQISSSRDKIAPLLARSILDPISRSKAEALPRYSHKCKLRVELDLSYVHALRPTAMNIRDARFSTREQQ